MSGYLMLLVILFLSACGRQNGVVEDSITSPEITDANTPELSITEFIDNHVFAPAADCMYVLHGNESFELSKEQWGEVRALFCEGTWVETENPGIEDVAIDSGFISFHSDKETIAFSFPQCVIWTVEFAPESADLPRIKNRYYSIDGDRLELIIERVEYFEAEYEPPQGMGG